MKNIMSTKNLIASIIITAILLNAMIKTPSPKIIFVPFLICSMSMIGKSISQMFNKQKWERIFGKIYVLGFASFFIGFLIVAAYISVRDKNYSMLIFSLPFWFIGLHIIKKKLGFKGREKSGESNFPISIVMGAGLVLIVLLAGIILLIMGIKRTEMELIFAGMFFAFGAFTFVLAALTIHGSFDRFGIDVLGTYIGVLFVAIGIGTVALKFRESYSIAVTIQTFRLWIIIPILMVVVGIIQVVKSLRRKENN